MPGVPTSKGCEACRKAKKKCDELHPCSRCNRLQAECIGSGQRRFQFKNAHGVLPITQTARRQNGLMKASPKPVIRSNICLAIRNPNEEVQAAIIYALRIKDVRFDLGYYGNLLDDIPRRLGFNAALDSAVKALVTIYPSVYSRVLSPNMLLEYGRALRTLRGRLDDPIEARSTNTFCAIYIIMICESWLGDYNSDLASHGRIITCLLETKNLERIEDDLEKRIIITLAASVVPEAIVNPEININLWVFKQISLLTQNSQRDSQDSDIPRPTTDLHTLARFPKWIRGLATDDLSDVLSVYLQLRHDSQKMLACLDEWSATKAGEFSYLVTMQRSRYQAAYTISISMGLILNALLRPFYQVSYALKMEGNFYCDEIILQSELATCYRPLGAAYVPLCLVIVLATAEHQSQIQRANALLDAYQTDFKGVPWFRCAGWLKKTFESYRDKNFLSVNDDLPGDVQDYLAGNDKSSKLCRVM